MAMTFATSAERGVAVIISIHNGDSSQMPRVQWAWLPGSALSTQEVPVRDHDPPPIIGVLPASRSGRFCCGALCFTARRCDKARRSHGNRPLLARWVLYFFCYIWVTRLMLATNPFRRAAEDWFSVWSGAPVRAWWRRARSRSARRRGAQQAPAGAAIRYGAVRGVRDLRRACSSAKGVR